MAPAHPGPTCTSPAPPGNGHLSDTEVEAAARLREVPGAKKGGPGCESRCGGLCSLCLGSHGPITHQLLFGCLLLLYCFCVCFLFQMFLNGCFWLMMAHVVVRVPGTPCSSRRISTYTLEFVWVCRFCHFVCLHSCLVACVSPLVCLFVCLIYVLVFFGLAYLFGVVFLSDCLLVVLVLLARASFSQRFKGREWPESKSALGHENWLSGSHEWRLFWMVTHPRLRANVNSLECLAKSLGVDRSPQKQRH